MILFPGGKASISPVENNQSLEIPSYIPLYVCERNDLGTKQGMSPRDIPGWAKFFSFTVFFIYNKNSVSIKIPLGESPGSSPFKLNFYFYMKNL